MLTGRVGMEDKVTKNVIEWVGTVWNEDYGEKERKGCSESVDIMEEKRQRT